MILLILGNLIFSPLCLAEPESLSSEKIKVGHIVNFSDPFARTQDVIKKYSNGDREVANASHLFLSHLHESYGAEEGGVEKDLLRILESIKFSALKHQNQTRKNLQATPYIIHPIGVADHLLVVGGVRDPDILISALLHDTVEDTNTSFEEIREAFGPRVESFIREVSDDRSLSQLERKALQIVHAPEKSAGAAQIKLADKYYNLNDLYHSPPPDWDKERVDAYFDWAEKVVHALPKVNAPLLKAVDQIIANHRGRTPSSNN